MGQKASPIGMRVGIHANWRSRWFGGSRYPQFLKDDLMIRDFLSRKLKNMGVDKVQIDRGNAAVRVTIHAARPGLIIGRGGAGIQDLQKKLADMLGKKTPLQLEIQELRDPESSAAVTAEFIIDQIEKRTPFRRIMRQAMAKLIGSREVKGAKIQLSGRLDGAEIARVEHLSEGSLPLQTLRADIDFVRATAMTPYGTIGVKVWVYKGHIFE